MAQKVVVVGAGIVGASFAWHLAQAGAAVTVIEAAGIASAATEKSFGWINASFSETPAYFALRMAGIEAWREMGDALGPEAGLRWGGSLWWEEAGDALETQAAALRDLNYDMEVVGKNRVMAMVPGLAQAPDAAIHVRCEGAVDMAAATRRMLDGAVGMGAKVLVGVALQGVEAPGGRARAALTSHGRIEADAVVLATGAASGAVLAALDFGLPMDNKRGMILHTAPTAPLLEPIVLAPGVHVRQATDGHLVVGEIFSGDGPGAARLATDPAGLAAEVMARLAALLPATRGLALERVMLGTRPVPGDGFPAVGPVPGIDGLYLATMHSGITLAPVIGQLGAAEVMGGPDAALLAPYRPARFA
ncbi:MAG: FAD-dependent oxidoreductase [Limimaricola sp.]|uniref:NAD(P)/FAD-dependent oxidoreductase n=1 Tax=Limimaricola sp. TaxID=2211665 RepID=UPI001DCEA100|nr:FAD-dependent oxidoreductase [Limimaricola sp.]MBI1416732.1 FAD-dependent oxidoreductase [Limimaricola sp.]